VDTPSLPDESQACLPAGRRGIVKAYKIFILLCLLLVYQPYSKYAIIRKENASFFDGKLKALSGKSS